MKKILLSLLLLLFIHGVGFAKEECYLHIIQAGNFAEASIESAAIALFGEYVEPLSPTPLGGINIFKKNACLYRISISVTKEGISLSLSGRKINALSVSSRFDLNGLNHALLRAIRNSNPDPNLKQRICKKYKQLMAKDCVPVSGLVALYDENGRIIPNEAKVRSGEKFHFMLQPSVDLHAYVISQDSQGQFFRVFPNPSVSAVGNPLQGGKVYYFPPKDSDLIFSFDENTGREKFFVLFSSVSMADLDELFVRLEKGDEVEENQKVLQKRIHTRGIGLVKNRVSVNLPTKKKNQTEERQLVELLEGKGELVKNISLTHLP